MPPVRTRARSSRALRRRALAVGVVALVALAACQQPAKKGAPPPPLPPLPSQYCHPSTPTSAGGYQAAFNGLFAANTKGWAGSDGGFPVAIGGGRVLWMFADTLVGRRAPNGSIQGDWQLPSNGFVVQNGRCFTPITHPIPGSVWPVGAVRQGNQLWVFGTRMKPGGSLGFQFDRAVVARFSLPGLNHISTQTLNVPTNRKYGTTVAFDNTYVYAYGFEPSGPPPFGPLARRHYVARAPRSNLSSWEYWTKPAEVDEVEGTVEELGVEASIDDEVYWVAGSPGAGQAKPMLFPDGGEDPTLGPGAAFSVAPWDGAFLGSALDVDLFGTKLETWHGAGPQGPWQHMATAVGNIQSTTAKWAYGGRVVLNVGLAPRIALWSVHPGSMNAILANPNLYRVRFGNPSGQSLTPPPPEP